MGLQRTVDPTEKILSLAQAKSHLRVNIDDDDNLILRLIDTATNYIEDFIRRALSPQTWEYTLNAFPNGNILLPMAPLQSVTDIKYIDEDGVEQTWADTEYDVFTNKMPGYVRLAYDKTYPTIRSTQDAITITYVAGYATPEKIPPAIINAALLIIGHYYDHREDSQVGGSIVMIPAGAETLLYPHRMFTP